MFADPQRIKQTASVEKYVKEYLHEYLYYLSQKLYHLRDFYGSDWITKQKCYVLSDKSEEISYLFKKLFVRGFLYEYERVNQFSQYSFISGVNRILRLLEEKHGLHYENKRDNRRFFTSPHANDFEGLWAELILLDYLDERGFKVFPADNPSHVEKKSADLCVMKGGTKNFIQVKCFTDAKFCNGKMSIFANLEPTNDETKNIIRRFRDSIDGFHSSIIAVIDISLYYELFSKIIGTILLRNRQMNENFREALNSTKRNMEKDYPLFFQLRAPHTELLSGLYLVGN